MLYLHIGLPKTGTTFLQYRIFNRQKQLAYLHDPNDRRPEALETLLKKHQRAEGHKERRSLGDQIASSIPHERMLISNEAISSLVREPWEGSGPHADTASQRLAELGAKTGGIKVILGIRRQDKWLASRYAESAKAYPTFGQDDFDQRIPKLVSGKLSGSQSWLDYNASCSALVRELGADNVLILPSEQVSDEPQAALRSLEGFLECPGLVEIYEGQKPGTDRRNVLATGPNTWKLRGRDEEFLHMSDALSEEIMQRFKDSNVQIAQRTGLALQELGYY